MSRSRTLGGAESLSSRAVAASERARDLSLGSMHAVSRVYALRLWAEAERRRRDAVSRTLATGGAEPA